MNNEHILPQLLLRAWPFPRGAGRMIDRLFSTLTFRSDVATVRTTDGFLMTVFPNDHIGRHIYLSGEFDRSTGEMLCRLARSGDVLLDVGANIGYVSGCFLSNVPQSRVIAVEPQPRVIDLLRKNLRQFGENRYQIAPVALSERDESGWLEICGRNLGASKLVSSAGPDAVRIETWSADHLLRELNPSRIDLIKIDVEGHEDVILRALRPAIANYAPRAILFEDHGTKAAPENSIGGLLSEAGYRVFGIKKRLTSLVMVPILSERDCTTNDYVGMHDQTRLGT